MCCYLHVINTCHACSDVTGQVEIGLNRMLTIGQMHLQELDVSRTNFPVYAFCYRWTGLTSLMMDDVHAIDIDNLRHVCIGMAGTLRHLSLARCQFIYSDHNDDIFFLLLVRLRRTLHYLIVEGINISADVVDTLRSCMPHRHVVVYYCRSPADLGS